MIDYKIIDNNVLLGKTTRSKKTQTQMHTVIFASTVTSRAIMIFREITLHLLCFQGSYDEIYHL